MKPRTTSWPGRPGAGPLSAPVVLLKISSDPVTGDDLACTPPENVRSRVRACSTEILRDFSRCVMLLALAEAIAAIVWGSVVLMSTFGNRRDLAGSSWTLITPLLFVCVALPALSTVCESEAANKTAIATTKTRVMGFLRGDSRDIQSSLVIVFEPLRDARSQIGSLVATSEMLRPWAGDGAVWNCASLLLCVS